jgi:hypothetical protein
MRLKFKNKIKDFRVVHSLIRNWLDVILFRLKIKRKFTMILNDGSKIRIVNRKDYFEFFSGMKFKEFQLKALSLKKKNSTLSFNYNGKTLKFFCPKEKEQDMFDTLNNIALYIGA